MLLKKGNDMWKPEPHTLRWPLTIENDQVLTELPLRPILHGEHAELLEALDEQKAARAAKGDPMEDVEYDESAFIGLAAMATGYPESVIQQLKRPDFNGLSKRVLEMVSFASDAFMTSEQKLASSKDNPVLLVPLKGSDGFKHDRIQLEVPALEATRMMRRVKGARQRAEFITAKCTGLIPHDLHQLTVPDWNTLQERVNHFLNETADFFPSTTLTS